MTNVPRRDDGSRAASAAHPKRWLSAALMAVAVGCLPVAASASPASASTPVKTGVASTLESASFIDVDPSNQFYNEISWLAAEGISTGYPDHTFRPVQAVNRDTMAAFLYRLAGSPDYVPPAASPFTDVTPANVPSAAALPTTALSTGWDAGGMRHHRT